MGLIILVVLVLLLVGAFPRWEHSNDWGYGPSGVLGFLVIILVLYLLFGGGGYLHGWHR